jgi:hypothetical protein
MKPLIRNFSPSRAATLLPALLLVAAQALAADAVNGHASAFPAAKRAAIEGALDKAFADSNCDIPADNANPMTVIFKALAAVVTPENVPN